MKNKDISFIVDKLREERSLSLEEYLELVEAYSLENAEHLARYAVAERKKYYSNSVYIRGLIEISNICKNNCLYCGIRRENSDCQRYRLTKEEILDCCREGYELGFRTFVMQGGEDGFFTDDYLCALISEIKEKYNDCAITLSLGERSYESYKKLYEAGADRYLLRHETADEEHYAKLHPENMSYKTRIECLYNLKEIGYQVGCGFMVGSPYQTSENIARDLKFIEEFKPHMCGIGPFIPHRATPFKNEPAGTLALTCYLLSIIRIIAPKILLPATTALGSIDENGREKGILSGANVVMPNLSPYEKRQKYELYNNKLYGDSESAQALCELKQRMNAIGYDIVVDRGDAK